MAEIFDKKILLAESERDLAEAIARAIRASGGSVDVVNDGVQAIDAFSDRDYDLILIGETISRRRYDEVALKFKLNGGRKAICILKSSKREKREKSDAFDGFLHTPFDNEKLISVAKGVLSEDNRSE